VSKHPFTFWLI
jgi:hypothetical protein